MKENPMSDPYFFGYGSLVNSQTHVYPGTQPAILHGWRRAWVGSPARGVVLLTAIESQSDSIEGLAACVPGGDWNALDTREEGYARVWTPNVHIEGFEQPPHTSVYSVLPEHRVDKVDQVILLSYLDVVAQGFLRVFGAEGLQKFFDTTDGWDTPVLNDRNAPKYPRHQSLTKQERNMVDDHLAQVSAVVTSERELNRDHQF